MYILIVNCPWSVEIVTLRFLNPRALTLESILRLRDDEAGALEGTAVSALVSLRDGCTGWGGAGD